MFNQKFKKDFFFGEIILTKGVASKNLNKVLALAADVSGEHFVAQINRVLVVLGGKLELTDGASCPDLYQLFDKISGNNILKIVLESYTQINGQPDCTLGCKIYLEQGIVDIKACWCTHKKKHAIYLFDTLIAPIHKYKLADKTYVYDGEVLSKLDENGSEYDYEVREILSLSACRWYFDDIDFVNSMAQVLCDADKNDDHCKTI